MKAMNNRWSDTSFGWLVGCVMFFAALRCEAQGNLISNHSFEERNDCVGLNQVHYPDSGPLGWFSGGGTPDYIQTCLGSGASFGVPLSYWCYQYPQHGESYVGMVTYDQVFVNREYFMTELLEPLVPGQVYYASFYASAGWGGTDQQVWLASSGVGLLFTMQARQWEVGDPVSMGVGHAQVHYPSILADTVAWVLVSGSFVADSAYRYVMVGNQFSNAETDTLHFADLSWNPIAYTVVDNVCVSTDPLGCPMTTMVSEGVAEAINVYPNPASHSLVVTGLQESMRMSIIDAIGRTLWNGITTGSGLTWDVRTWSRGTYVLRMEGSETSRSFKFVLIE